MSDVRNPTPQMQPVFNELFKFKIGEKVIASRTLMAFQAEEQLNENPIRDYERLGGLPALTIMGRRVEECHGGIQMHYIVSGPVGEPAVILAEFEIAPYEEGMAVLRRMKKQPQ